MRADSVALTLVLLGSALSLAGAAQATPDAAFNPSATGSISKAPALRPAIGEPATAPAAPRPPEDVRTAPVWCGSGRIVGSGAGFCEIN